MTPTEILDKALNIINILCISICPIFSALSVLIISYFFNVKIEKLRIDWEKEKKHKDFRLTLFRERKDQIELFIKNYSQAFLEVQADIIATTLLNSQEQLDTYRKELLYPLSQLNTTPDDYKVNFECKSVIRSLKNERLIEILNEIEDLGIENGEIFDKYIMNNIELEVIIRDKESIKNKLFAIQDKYLDLLSKFYEQLDITFLGYDPFAK